MKECYEAFIKHFPELEYKYTGYTEWLYSYEDIVIGFRAGWVANN